MTPLPQDITDGNNKIKTIDKFFNDNQVIIETFDPSKDKVTEIRAKQVPPCWFGFAIQSPSPNRPTCPNRPNRLTRPTCSILPTTGNEKQHLRHKFLPLYNR